MIPHAMMKNNCKAIDVVITLTRGRHMPTNKRSYIHAYIELQCWPLQCHTIYTKYARGMEN